MTGSLLNYLHEYGEHVFTLIVFVWTALEGETIVIIAGFYAHQGWLKLYYLIPAAWLGSFLGDQVYFTLGRKFGHKILKKRPKWQKGADRALALFERYDTLFILSFRFIYGVRNFSSFGMGLSHVSWIRFCYLNFIAAGVWASSFAFLGYGLSSIFVNNEEDASSLAKWIGLGMLLLFVIAVGVAFRLNKRRNARKNAQAEKNEAKKDGEDDNAKITSK